MVWSLILRDFRIFLKFAFFIQGANAIPPTPFLHAIYLAIYWSIYLCMHVSVCLFIQVAYARPPTPSFMKDYIEWIQGLRNDQTLYHSIIHSINQTSNCLINQSACLHGSCCFEAAVGMPQEYSVGIKYDLLTFYLSVYLSTYLDPK